MKSAAHSSSNAEKQKRTALTSNTRESTVSITRPATNRAILLSNDLDSPGVVGNDDTDDSIEEIEPPQPKETPQAELGTTGLTLFLLRDVLIKPLSERLQKDWVSPVYAFFDPTPMIQTVDGRRVHVFKCLGKGCTSTVRRFLDTKDKQSTGNMYKHVKLCWGDEVLKTANGAKDISEVHGKIVPSILRTGSITAAFERKGNGKVTYSTRQHTRSETR